MVKRTVPPADVQEAFYRVVHDFGVVKLAGMMGTSPAVLYNKANHHESSHHKPTLADALVVSNLTGDKRIPFSFAAACDGTFFELPDVSHISDTDLVQGMCNIGMEGGDFYRVMNKALEDNSISGNDFAAIEHEALEWIAAIAEMLERVRGLKE